MRRWGFDTVHQIGPVVVGMESVVEMEKVDLELSSWLEGSNKEHNASGQAVLLNQDFSSTRIVTHRQALSYAIPCAHIPRLIVLVFRRIPH